MNSKELTDNLTEQVNEIIRITNESFLPLDDARLNWKESSAHWSILECLEHLNRYNTYYLGEITRGIALAPQLAGTVEVQSSWIGKKFISMMHPDNVKKQKTFSRMNPVNSSLTREVLQKFLDEQNSLLNLLSLARNINPNKGNVPVEFFRLISLSIGDTLKFVIVHQQRHINQALHVLSKKEGRPSLVV